jgi:hypothetical protein
MLIGRIEGATTTLCAPNDWDEDRNGKCMDLPIRQEVINGSLPALTSAWLPTPEELARLNAGAPVPLRVIAIGHPPVILDVGDVPA